MHRSPSDVSRARGPCSGRILLNCKFSTYQNIISNSVRLVEENFLYKCGYSLRTSYQGQDHSSPILCLSCDGRRGDLEWYPGPAAGTKMPMKPLLSLSPSRSSLHNSLQAGAGRKPRLLLIPKGGGARGSIVKTSFHGESCCCGLKKGPRRGSSLFNLFFISFGHAEDECHDRRDDFVIHP